MLGMFKVKTRSRTFDCLVGELTSCLQPKCWVVAKRPRTANEEDEPWIKSGILKSPAIILALKDVSAIRLNISIKDDRSILLEFGGIYIHPIITLGIEVVIETQRDSMWDSREGWQK